MQTMGMRSIEEIRTLLSGPVNSIPTTFTPEGDLDEKGIRNIVEAGISGGSSVSLITFGDSHLELLSDQEVFRLSRIVAEQANRRALTVAATGRWSTAQSVGLARACRELGIDMLMVTLAPHMMGIVEPWLAQHYLAVAQEIPVMIVGYPDYRLLDQLLNEPRICSFKEDGSVEYAVDTMRRYGDHWTFMTGGGLWRNYTQWPFGCRAFMSPWCNIKPEVNRQYYTAMQRNDIESASRVITMLDWPLFDLSDTYTGGWQTMWRAILELAGLARRYRRPPFPSATDAEMERLRSEFGALEALAESLFL